MGCGERDDDAGSATSAPEPTQEAQGPDEESEDLELPELDEDDEIEDPLEEEDSDEGLGGNLTGAGSSLAAVLLDKVDLHLSGEYGIGVDYQSVGDSAGKDDFLAGAVDFAVVTTPLTEEQWEESQTVCGPDGAFQVPLAAAPLAVHFNLDGVEELNLDAETLAGIFRGEITSWDDDRIAEHNPDEDLPSTEIIPVHQETLSGTNLSFTQYLAAGAGAIDELDAEAYPATSVYYGVFCTEYDDAETADMVWALGSFIYDEDNPIHDDDWFSEVLPTGETALEALEAIAQVS